MLGYRADITENSVAHDEVIRGHVTDPGGNRHRLRDPGTRRDYIAWEISHLDRGFVLNSNSIPLLVTAQYFISLTQ
jgi:hypothetical protein